MTSGIAGYKGGRINIRKLRKGQRMEEQKLTPEEIEALNEAARQTCAWETTWQTEETWK